MGCNSKFKSIPSLKPERSKSEFRDSTYFSSTWNIQRYNGAFFITDSRNERVLELDASLDLMRSFGRAGRGPGEFNFIGSIVAHADSLYVYDGGGMRFHVYSLEGGYIRSFPVPYPLNDARIVLLKNRLYMASTYASGDSSSIFITDLQGNVIKHFEKNPSANPRINLTNRLLFDSADKGEILAVSTSEPFVERYSADGEFLGFFDLRRIEALKYLWDLYEENKSRNTRRHETVLFTDAYMDEAFLYINCAGWPGRDNYTYLVKLEVAERSIKLVSVFKIQGAEDYPALFQTIFVDGDTLIATDISTDAIYTFDLSGLN